VVPLRDDHEKGQESVSCQHVLVVASLIRTKPFLATFRMTLLSGSLSKYPQKGQESASCVVDLDGVCDLDDGPALLAE
jgi:hypothetical protein